jgi:N utilization substance protein B
MSSAGPKSHWKPRSIARQLAFQLLYQDELNPSDDPAVNRTRTSADWDRGELEETARELYETTFEDEVRENGRQVLPSWPESPELVEFTRFLVLGVRRYCEQLDEQLARATYHWRIQRMAVTDRTILRLATFEILHTETPDPVAIDEAIELAKRFGSAQSGQFVNGILDRVMQREGDGGV